MNRIDALLADIDAVLRMVAGPITPPATINDAERTDPAEGERTRDGSAEAAQAVSANQPSSPTPTPALGCRWCGVEQRGHGQRWMPGMGFHVWDEPTREQVRTRMRDRYAGKVRPDPDAVVDFARTAGLPLEPWQERVLRDSFATGGPIHPGGVVLAGGGGCGLTLQIDTSAIGSVPPPSGEEILRTIREFSSRTYGRAGIHRVEMHRSALARLRATARPAGLSSAIHGVPIIPDDTLPPYGWRMLGHDGQVLAQYPPPAPEPTGFITTTKPPPDKAWLRPRPAPRPPWWRRALDRIRGAR